MKNKIIFILLLIFLVISIIGNIFVMNLYINKPNNFDENIILLGDSITEGYDEGKFFPGNNVINKGISGNKSEDLIDRLKTDVYDYNPTKVFILIGVNDLISSIDEEDILLNIQTIINGIKINRKESNIYIESIYPINNEIINEKNVKYASLIDNERIQNLNIKINELCKNNNIEYINVYDKLTDKSGNLKNVYTTDGLHISSLGYLKITSIISEYIKK